MERKIVLEEELISILNSELSKYEECKDCRFMGPPTKLVELDKNGCNWSYVTLRCSGVPSEICRPFADRIVLEVKKKYNIKSNVARNLT